MSRIDEAMKRAAAMEAGASAHSGLMPAPPPANDVAELAREAYQTEERTPVRDIAAAHAAAPTPSAVPPSIVASADVVSGAEVMPLGAPASAAASSSVLENGASFSFERIDARYAGKTVVDQDISPASREQYRRLAASLHHAKDASGLTVVMVSSAVSGEGKTLTSSNLALTLSESYKKNVLLIDTDLRKPSLHSVFCVRGDSGLSEGLAEGSDRAVPVYQVSARLAILSAGRQTTDPIARLTSPRMRRLLAEARRSFDWIILDTPPVAFLPDANLISAMVDGAILVIKAGSTPYPLVQRALDAVGKNKVLGVVLNRATTKLASNYYGYYSYSYGSSQSADAAALPAAVSTDSSPTRA